MGCRGPRGRSARMKPFGLKPLKKKAREEKSVSKARLQRRLDAEGKRGIRRGDWGRGATARVGKNGIREFIGTHEEQEQVGEKGKRRLKGQKMRPRR